ncbi:MAG TPA: PLDc N-terminal domain-containing protein [Candidatus Saccharimonadales bacterium]
MDILLTLLPVFMIGGLFVLWTAMLVHAVKSKIPSKLLWVVVLILTSVIGAPVYFFVVYRKTAKKRIANYSSVLQLQLA